MEPGNRDEGDRPGATLPSTTRQPQPDDAGLSQYYTHSQTHQDQLTDPFPPSDHHDLASYASYNLQSTDVNAARSSERLGDVDPDEFYRTYQGPDDYMNTGSDQFMASTVSATTRLPQKTPKSSAAGGSAPRHPPTDPPRSRPRPSTRSFSAPIDPKAQLNKSTSTPTTRSRAGYGAGQKPSVKDLKKRFDQQASQGMSNHGRPKANSGPRVPARETSLSPSATDYRGFGTSGQAARSLSSTRQTQRARAFPEDAVSSNPQSFASRIGKPPRLSIGAHAHIEASKPSMSNPSPTLSSALSSPTSPAHQGRSLLFGEILPNDTQPGAVGFGIEDPTVQTSLHQRSSSQPNELEPSSPTDWYRGVTSPPTSRPENSERNKLARSRAHARAHSSPTRTPAPASRTHSAQDVSRPPQSRLPLPVKNLSSGTSSPTSSPSTRANSPALLRKQPTPDAKAPRSNPTARAKTPTGKRVTRRPGQINPATASSSSGNARLNAYISAPPPKLSPPLRSSRPRQPVSSATTTSSRMRANDKGKAPSTLDTNQPAPRRRKISMGPIDFESRREQIKLSYTKSIREGEAREAAQKAAEARKKRLEAEAQAARAKAAALEKEKRQREEHEQREAELREQQRRAAESEEAERLELENQEAERLEAEIREAERQEAERQESERLEFERREAERLEFERQEAEQMETESRAAVAALQAAEAAAAEHHQHITSPGPTDGAVDDMLVVSEANRAPALTVTTNLHSQAPPQGDEKKTVLPVESPPLGIPGSFPGIDEVENEAPQSAVSNTTEFDIEPQTEPPQKQQDPPAQQEHGLGLEPPLTVDTDAPRSEYRSPFDEVDEVDEANQFADEQGEESPKDDDIPIKISLDALSAENAVSAETEVPEAEQTQDQTEPDWDGEDDIPVSFKYDENEGEYQPLPLPVTGPSQTTVTIIGRTSGFSSTIEEPSALRRESDHLPVTEENESELLEDGQKDPHQQENLDHDPYFANDQSAGLRKMEEYFVGPAMQRDSAVLLNDSSTSRSNEGVKDSTMDYHGDGGSLDEATHGTARTTTTTTLAVPRTSESANRASQATIWTDFSINSQEAYSSHSEKMPNGYQHRDSTFMEERSISEAPSRDSRSYMQDERDFPSSPGVSLHGADRAQYGDHEQSQRHDPLDADPADGFSLDYGHHETSSVISSVAPTHPPPPPPISAPPSEYYGGDTRPSSYVHINKDDQSLYSVGPSGHGSDDFAQSGTRHDSLDHGSIEIVESGRPSTLRLDSQQTLAEGLDQSQDVEALSPKERKRLFTRLEIIKELVDTEAFFIRDMNIVEEIYKGTAEACPRLDDNSIKLIFRNTDQIIAFHSEFLAELKTGVAPVYTPRSHRLKDNPNGSDAQSTVSTPATGHLSDDKDRETSLGPIFLRSLEKMKAAHETFLKNSDHAAKRLIQIQEDPTVQVWLNECNDVARELTKAWNLDSLLIKPMQRITKYPTLLVQLLHETPADHPDRQPLEDCKAQLEDAIEEINKTKKNFELVGQIVGRKRKESDVKAGLARAFGKRVDKLQASSNREQEDPEYLKLHERFGDDYLRLQVVLRDVEFYTRQVTAYVHEFLQYLSSMELVMRLQPSPHPEIESKWVRFNVSMRDVEKVALEQHLSQVRKHVIEPFEQVIKAYGNPSLAMKKRTKRRVDYDKSMQLKKNGKKIDKQLTEFMEQYEALNDTLKKELPKLSALTEKVGRICLANLVNIQTQWYGIWKEKVKAVLEDGAVPELADVVSTFERDYKFQEDQIQTIGIVNPASRGRPSQSASATDDSASARLRPRPPELRGRGQSLGNDRAPSLPTPDFLKRQSGQFSSMSPTTSSIPPSPHHFYYRDYYSGIASQSETSTLARSTAPGSNRPGTGHSHDSFPRQSTEQSVSSLPYASPSSFSPPQALENHRYSGFFQSALPMSDSQEQQPRPSMGSMNSDRGSSRERTNQGGFNVLWLAASLFEFNIQTTKHEAGYPYLTYQAGEIFDVIAEKGELWLAKNQDDPGNVVGWLWSKHFAKLADD